MWQRFFRSILDLLYPHACVACQQAGEVVCEECLRTVKPVPVTETLNGLSVTSVFAYDAPVLAQALQAWKYDGIQDAIIPFLHLYPPQACDADALVAVPLHRRRRLERGFNQSDLLADHLAKDTGIPVFEGMKRIRYTTPQAQQDREGRLMNVKDAFVWKGESIRGKHVVLVDDVVTTGSTLLACAQVLKNAGAARVSAWCLCRSK